MKTNYLNTLENNNSPSNNGFLQEEDHVSSFDRNAKSVKDIILPSGIDASNYDHIEIFSKKAKYARSFYISAVPRMATFVEFLNSMYDFGDINVSVHIEPINEAESQKSLNNIFHFLT